MTEESEYSGSQPLQLNDGLKCVSLVHLSSNQVCGRARMLFVISCNAWSSNTLITSKRSFLFSAFCTENERVRLLAF